MAIILELNIKVIGSDIHISVYDKRDDFGFPIVNFPWLSGDVPRLPSYGIYISHVALAFWISILKISKLLQNCWHRVKDITSFEKTFVKFFRSYSELLSKFGDISFQEYVFKEISHSVFYVVTGCNPNDLDIWTDWCRSHDTDNDR